ncbi:hypothetical protein F4780DRAFT_779613 [Xylariomycetidae sp. FL0641]|nr:hypothetical protein F4780DRAFT_779613 [Xylariomycetidae sp. FL0641]
MAEPTNTPMPTAPPTPRSTSPAPPVPATSSGLISVSTSTNPANTTTTTTASSPTGAKPVVLHLGDAIQHHAEAYRAFAAAFAVVRPGAAERGRAAFAQALRERRWGDFAAVLRPAWGSGGEMGAWDRELVALLPGSVRVVAGAGAGFEWADVRALGERGIIYCNSGVAAADAVADFAVALIVSTFRALPYCIASAGAGSEASFRAAHAGAPARAHNLRGATLGLVGLGNVGRRVAARCAAAFAMDVAYYDVVERKPPPGGNDPSAEGTTPPPPRYCPSLEALVRQADCVVLCAPGGAGRLITAEALAWFRPGARLVNVARGSLVDEEALAAALEAGRLAGAALDVHAHEPRVAPRLRALADRNVLLTCHNAGGTVETHAGFEELCMRNVTAVLEGREPLTPVNLQWLQR